MVRIAPTTEGGIAEWTAALRHCLDHGVLTELPMQPIDGPRALAWSAGRHCGDVSDERG